MKTFEIRLIRTSYVDTQIEAEDEDDAREKAYNNFKNGAYDFDDEYDCRNDLDILVDGEE